MPDVQAPPPDPTCLLKRTLVTTDELDEKFHTLVKDLLNSGRGLEVVRIIEEIIVDGSVAKTKLLTAALAICLTHATGNAADTGKTRRAVCNRLKALCPIPSTLFLLLKLEKEYSPLGKVSGE